jgi:hypothetical protein
MPDQDGVLTLATIPHYESLKAGDRETVERQLGRRLRGRVGVAARCPYGVVEVIATSPVLDGGTPFPTLFWLTCPLLQRAVSGLENGGFRDVLRRKALDIPGFAEALRQGEMDYADERDRWASELGAGDRIRTYFKGREGVGGTRAGGMKCLHAHLAHFLAGGNNPVGAEVLKALEGRHEKDCKGDCGPFLREEKRR